MNTTKSLCVIFLLLAKYILIFSLVDGSFSFAISVVFTFFINSSMSWIFFFFFTFCLFCPYGILSMLIGNISLSFNILTKFCFVGASTLFLTTSPLLVIALYIYTAILIAFFSYVLLGKKFLLSFIFLVLSLIAL